MHGVLLLDKPRGMSSNAALQKVKWLLRADKAGHTGTLDPLATGLLPLCFGAATKFSQVQLDADKTYLATLALGATTTTGDAEGEVLRTRPVGVTPEQIDAVLAQHTGPQRQTPPMHSALKHEGRALYEYARAGISVERAARDIVVHRIDKVEQQGATLTLRVACSKGTYIRTLAEDIGEALGCGAHLAALRRLATGALRLEDAVTIEQLEPLADAERLALLAPVELLLDAAPPVRLAPDEAGRFLSGLRRRTPLNDVPQVRVYGPEPRAFLGTAHITGHELIPDRLLSPLELQQILGTTSS